MQIYFKRKRQRADKRNYRILNSRHKLTPSDEKKQIIKTVQTLSTFFFFFAHKLLKAWIMIPMEAQIDSELPEDLHMHVHPSVKWVSLFKKVEIIPFAWGLLLISKCSSDHTELDSWKTWKPEFYHAYQIPLEKISRKIWKYEQKETKSGSSNRTCAVDTHS